MEFSELALKFRIAHRCSVRSIEFFQGRNQRFWNKSTTVGTEMSRNI
jgi:hypothetical protein